MATQAEIDQVLGTWAANFLLLMTKRKFIDGTQLQLWFDKNIKSLYKVIGVANISLPTGSETMTCPRRDKRTSKALSTSYGNQLIKSFNSLRSELPGILNTLQIKNAGEILAAFDKIRISLNTTKVGCGK
jgi:hypothetical protein